MVKKLMKLIAWLRDRKKFKNPKKINLSNILNYAEAEVRFWKSTSKFLDNPKHIDEQSIWRLSEVKDKSPDCIQQLRCIGCGCQIMEKVFESKACEEGCYPEMMSKDIWEKYKENNKITNIN
jgi:hypothetical protein